MSSQKPGGTQSTLFSFFGKQGAAAPSTSSSSPAQRNAARPAPKPSSSSSKPAPKATGATKALTTSEADVLSLLSSDGPEVELEAANGDKGKSTVSRGCRAV